MTDLPINKKLKKENPVVTSPVDGQHATSKVEVTHENADILMVHFLSQMFGRLGYIIKLLEEKK